MVEAKRRVRHMRLGVCGLVVALLVTCGQNAARAGDRIFVLSQAGATLAELAIDTNEAGGSIALEKAPAAFAIAPDRQVAYVTHPDLSRLSIVDLAGRSVTKVVPVRGTPFGIAISRAGRLYVGDWNGSHVTVLDSQGLETATVSVGREPAHLLLSRDEERLFVANRASDSVTVIRTSDHAVEAEIPVGRAPFALASSHDGSRIYVGNVQENNVSVIDTRSLDVIETRPSGAMPYGAAVTRDDSRVLITNQQAGTVAVLGPSGELESIKVGGYPEGVAISTDGTRGYVANWFSDDVSVLDLRSLKELGRIKCAAGPRSIALVPQH